MSELVRFISNGRTVTKIQYDGLLQCAMSTVFIAAASADSMIAKINSNCISFD